MRRTLLFGFLFSVGLEAASSDARIAYEKALALEEASGRLDEAIALFQKVVAQASSDDALAAQAQLHVGICYEKLARREARAAYQAVLEKYPSQREPVRIARERLARLTASAVPPRAMAVREFQRSAAAVPGRLPEPADEPSEFATRDGVRFFFTDWNTGDLVVKDFATGKARALYGVDWSRSTEYFQAPVLSPDQKRIAFVAYTSGEQASVRIEIDNVSGGGRQVLCQQESGLYIHDWSPDGNVVLGSKEGPDRSVSLVTIHTKTKRIDRLVTLNWDYPLRARYSPDGRFIAYDSTKDGDRKIYLMTADGNEEHALVDSPGEDDSPVWSPDGRFVVFRSNRSGEWDLLALRVRAGKAAGAAVLIKTSIGPKSYLRTITPDGRLFYGEDLAGGEIVLMDRGDRTPARARTLPKIGTRDIGDLSFAPDGQRIVYNTGLRTGGARRFRVTTLEGEVLREFPSGAEYLFPRRPVFSPDGRKFAVRALDRRRQGVVLVFSPERGALLQVLTFDRRGWVPVGGWSADGRCLYAAAGGDAGERVELVRVDIATGERHSTVLPAGVNKWDVRVSPDGRILAMASKVPPETERALQIIVRNLAGGPDRVVRTDAVAGRLFWDFDSRHLLYRKARELDTLYRLSVESGTEDILATGVSKYALEDVSGDGRFLAFQTQTGRDSRIWVVENFLPAKPATAAAR